MSGDTEPSVDLAEHARGILETNRYVTLATVDAEGAPWASPVYFAPDATFGLWWVSETNARHSQNLAVRGEASGVVFDSTVPAYHGRAVYVSGGVDQPSGTELEEGLAVFPGPPTRGGSALELADVQGESPYRVYRLQPRAVWVLCPRDPGQPCALHGITGDHRAQVL